MEGQQVNVVIGKREWEKLSADQQTRIQFLIDHIVEILAEKKEQHGREMDSKGKN